MRIGDLLIIVFTLFGYSVKCDEVKVYTFDQKLADRLQIEILDNSRLDLNSVDCKTLTDICGDLENSFVQLLGIVDKLDTRSFNPFDGKADTLDTLVFLWIHGCPEIFKEDYVFKYLGNCNLYTRHFIYMKIPIDKDTETTLSPIFDELTTSDSGKFSVKLEYVLLFHMPKFTHYLTSKYDKPEYEALPDLIQKFDIMLRSDNPNLDEFVKVIDDLVQLDIVWADIYVLLCNLSSNNKLHPSTGITDIIKARHPELFQQLQEKWLNSLGTKH